MKIQILRRGTFRAVSRGRCNYTKECRSGSGINGYISYILIFEFEPQPDGDVYPLSTPLNGRCRGSPKGSFGLRIRALSWSRGGAIVMNGPSNFKTWRTTGPSQLGKIYLCRTPDTSRREFGHFRVLHHPTAPLQLSSGTCSEAVRRR